MTPRDVIADWLGVTITTLSDDERTEINAAANKLISDLSAAGYVIVPREPTRQMWAAGGTAIVHTRARTGSHDDQCGAVWDAMLAAVQETPGEKVSG